jgi:hypothetical protein
VQSTIVAAYGKRASCFRLEKYTLYAHHFEILDLMRRRNIDVCLVEGLGRLRAFLRNARHRQKRRPDSLVP